MFNKKNFLVTIIIIVAVLLVGGGVTWYKNCQEYVKRGLAKNTFPYTKYNQDELNSLYSQYPLENVATTQTPEQTYQKFREYLKNQDIDGALSLIFERYRAEYKKAFEKAKNEGKVLELYKALPETLQKVSCYDTICTYKIGNKDVEVEFVKNLQGVWLIESI
ncbi:MAG: hypothetical protein US42_C0004G0048 [Candidatus Magasanikbacteria bacterium GW2011_GWC2_37_14]|uniref:DUF4878 domain-containing protein n=1 Tax=Candidatus Magasanikbacteria bacterium GW2011_GWC2_37_14 TaxID=1619046 RepID=A0A0G0IUS0_9BACT|nr:MAG: hypothetical protein US42_C0004G0048 [Candidatus Magasanikbacteria bacterium GW2011_GWC2_37_14]